MYFMTITNKTVNKFRSKYIALELGFEYVWTQKWAY